MVLTYIQIGAGMGDRDPTTHFRDGFTEKVKRLANPSESRIILVEANSNHADDLMSCWRNWPLAEFHFIGVVPSTGQTGKRTFFWAEEDAPSFQLFSADLKHVQKYYPSGTIRLMDVDCLAIMDFLVLVVGPNPIEVLAVDIEGLDSDVLLAIQWEQIECHMVSFERLHLGKRGGEVRRRIRKAGYVFAGRGLDINGLDVLYIRPSNVFERLRCLLLSTSYYSNSARGHLRIRTRLRQVIARS